jgi:hypothetical protein
MRIPKVEISYDAAATNLGVVDDSPATILILILILISPNSGLSRP